MKWFTLVVIGFFMSLFPMHTDVTADSSLVIILLGPPGAGKGTHASPLSEKLGLPHISTGNLFRENIRNKTLLGKKVQSYMDQGLLVPDDLVLDLVFARIKQSDCKKGYILDGFPRTMYQAKALQQKIQPEAKVVALNLSVADNLLIERISGRLLCESCGASFHKIYAPPQKKGKCNHCKGSLYQRDDDEEKVVKNRLQVYKEKTQPLLDFYDLNNILYEVNAQKRPQEVFEEVSQTIEALFSSCSPSLEKNKEVVGVSQKVPG